MRACMGRRAGKDQTRPFPPEQSAPQPLGSAPGGVAQSQVTPEKINPRLLQTQEYDRTLSPHWGAFCCICQDLEPPRNKGCRCWGRWWGFPHQTCFQVPVGAMHLNPLQPPRPPPCDLASHVAPILRH